MGNRNIKDDLCKDINLLIDGLTFSKGRYASDEIKENIKNFLDELPPESQYENKLNFYKKNINNPLLAPYNYRKSFELEKSNSIRLLKEYLQSSTDLRYEIRIKPLKHFMSSPWALEIFSKEDNLKIFLNEALIEICKNKNPLLDELSEIGLNIKFYWPDIESEAFDMRIEFIQLDGISHDFEYSELKDFIDSETIDQINSLISPYKGDPESEFNKISQIANMHMSKLFRNFSELNFGLSEQVI